MNLPRDASAPVHAVFYFDFLSPEAFLASGQVARLAAIPGAHLTWEPVLTSHLQGSGPPVPDWEALREQARRWNRRLKVPPRFPFDSRPLLLAAVFVRERSGQETMIAMAHRIWRQIWEEGRDPENLDTAAAAGKEVAIPPSILLHGAADPSTGQVLDRLTSRAAARGVRTVPALFVEGSLYSGLDQFSGALRALEAAAHSPPRHPFENRPAGGGDDIPDWTFSG